MKPMVVTMVPPGFHSIHYHKNGGIMDKNEGGVTRGFTHLGRDSKPNHPLCGAGAQHDNESGLCPRCEWVVSGDKPLRQIGWYRTLWESNEPLRRATG